MRSRITQNPLFIWGYRFLFNKRYSLLVERFNLFGDHFFKVKRNILYKGKQKKIIFPIQLSHSEANSLKIYDNGFEFKSCKLCNELVKVQVALRDEANNTIKPSSFCLVPRYRLPYYASDRADRIVFKFNNRELQKFKKLSLYVSSNKDLIGRIEIVG